MAYDGSISVGAWYRRGWETFKAHPGTLIGAFLLYVLVSLVGVIPILGWIVIVAIAPPIVVGMYYTFLKAVRGEPTSAGGIFDGFSVFGSAWITWFLSTVIIIVGFILLIVPGIIFSLMYCMALFAVMDKKLSGMEALSFSSRITKGHKGKLFGAGLLAALLAVATIITLGLGLIIVGPWCIATLAAAYDSLSVAAVASPAAQTEGPAQPA